MNLLLSDWRCKTINKRDRVIWDLAVAAILWGIRRELDHKFFYDLIISFDYTFHVCHTFMSH